MVTTAVPPSIPPVRHSTCQRRSSDRYADTYNVPAYLRKEDVVNLTDQICIGVCVCDNAVYDHVLSRLKLVYKYYI